MPPNPPPPPPPTAKVRMEFTSVGTVIEEVLVVKRTMHVPSAVVESITVKFEVLVPSIWQLPVVTVAAVAGARSEKLGRPKEKIERRRIVTVERATRREKGA